MARTRRLIVRTLILLVSAFFASQTLRPLCDAAVERLEEGAWIERILSAIPSADLAAVLPGLSPLLGIGSAVARRAAGWMLLLCIPVLVMSWLKGRWFCRHLCPVGLMTETAGKLHPKAAKRFQSLPRAGPWIVLFSLSGAVLGYPALLWLDPLCIFNGFFSAWHKPLGVITAAPAVGLLLIVVLSVLRPNAWCFRLCPLGSMQELMGKLRHSIGRRTGEARKAADRSALGGLTTRRGILAALAGGAAGLVLGRRAGGGSVIRPPGAVPEKNFAGVCVRCGNCMRACPENIISPDFGASGVAGLLTPRVQISPGYCSEWCHECTKVCPTGAIKRLSWEDKTCVSIGTAVVTRKRCLAWEKSQYCMVCDEYCPYHAIGHVDRDGVPCPVVNPDKCRGCGLCQTVCPAENAAAIVVTPGAQRRMAPVEL